MNVLELQNSIAVQNNCSVNYAKPLPQILFPPEPITVILVQRSKLEIAWGGFILDHSDILGPVLY